MRFLKKTSFNTHDSQLTKDDNRITIHHNVQRRCELSLNGIIRFGNQGVSIKNLTEHLNRRLDAEYRESDIATAVQRLVTEGLVTISEDRKTYKATRNAVEKWRKIPKEHR